MKSIDFVLHPSLTVRLIGSQERHAHSMADQLGCEPLYATNSMSHGEAASTGPCDLTIRFTTEPLRRPELRVTDTQFTRDGTLIIVNAANDKSLVEIPMSNIGGQLEITCDSSVQTIPLLEEILQLHWLGNGLVPLHASGFVLHGIGLVCAGFPQGGKTGVLLAAMDAGGQLLSDDCVVVGPNEHVFGNAAPLTIKSRYLEQLPGLRSAIKPADLRKLARQVRYRVWSRSLGLRLGKRFLPRKLVRKLKRIRPENTALELSPSELFGSQRCVTQAEAKVVLVTTGHDSSATFADSISPQRLVEKLSKITHDQQALLADTYSKIQFALPGFCTSALEQMKQRSTDLLMENVSSMKGYELFHPHQGSIRGFQEVLEELTSHQAQ